MFARDYAFPRNEFMEGFFCGPRVTEDERGTPTFLMAVAGKLMSGARCDFVMLADEAFRLRDTIEGPRLSSHGTDGSG